MIYRSLILMFAVWSLAVPLWAQAMLTRAGLSQTNAAQVDPDTSVPLAKDLQKRFMHMSRRYKLTNVQQSQVRSILFKEQQDRETVSADPYMSPKDKREEQASLFDASQQKIGAILTQQQKRKFDADEKRRAWMDGRLPNPNPGPSMCCE